MEELIEPACIAYHFNEYFPTVADNLVRKIQKTDIDPLTWPKY